MVGGTRFRRLLASGCFSRVRWKFVLERGKTPRRGPIPEASGSVTSSVVSTRLPWSAVPDPCGSTPLLLALLCSWIQFCLELIMMMDRSPGQPTGLFSTTLRKGSCPLRKTGHFELLVGDGVIHDHLFSHPQLWMGGCYVFL